MIQEKLQIVCGLVLRLSSYVQEKDKRWKKKTQGGLRFDLGREKTAFESEDES